MCPRPAPRLAVVPLVALVLAGLPSGCGGPADTGTGSGLPPETGDGGSVGQTTDAGTSWTGTGAGGGPAPGDDESPGHALTLLQGGSWTLSPPAPPYESITGSLTVTELLDGDEDLPACTATFALTGTARSEEEAACEGCSGAFEVLHVLSEDGALIPGDKGEDDVAVPGLEACLAPDLPTDGDTWILALYSDEIDRRLGLSGWQPWYDAARIGATVDFEWTATVGLEGRDEETTP